jgi:ABC-type lipoprotein release transport system permease subunit
VVLRILHGIVSLVEKQEEVVAVARQINFSVFFRSGSKKINGRVSGIELEPEDKLFKSSEILPKAIGTIYKPINQELLLENCLLKTSAYK